MEFHVKSCFGCGSFDLEDQHVTSDTSPNDQFDFFCTLFGLPSKKLVEFIGIVNKMEFCGNCHAALENAATIMREIKELEKSLGEIKDQVSAKIVSKCRRNSLTADKMSKLIAQCISTCQVVVSPLSENDVRKFTRKRRSKKKAKNFISRAVKLEKIQVTDATTADDLLDIGHEAVAESIMDNEEDFPQIIQDEEDEFSLLNALNSDASDTFIEAQNDKKDKDYRSRVTPKKRKRLEESCGKRKRKPPPNERMCPICKEVFKIRSDLSVHMSSVHNQNIRTSCKHCGLDYASCAIKSPKEGSASRIKSPEEGSASHIKSPEEGSSTVIKTREEGSSSVIKTPEGGSSSVIKTEENGSSSVIKTREEGSSSFIKTPEEASSSVIKTPEEASSSVIKTPEEASSSLIKSSEERSSSCINAPEGGGSLCVKGPEEGSSSSDVVYACNMGKCKRTYKTLFDFRRHHFGKCPQNPGLRKLTQETRICEYCAQTFKNTDVLKTHIALKHEHAFNFYCEHCGKGFVARSSCMDHVKNVHTTEKRYACDECPYKCKLPRQLVLHKRRHTGELPFVCEHCGKAFPMRSHWRKHVTNMHDRGEFKCPMCSKTFASPNYVFNHISFVHHGFRGGNKKAKRPSSIIQTESESEIDELVDQSVQFQPTSNEVPTVDDGGQSPPIVPPGHIPHIPQVVPPTSVPTVDDGGQSPPIVPPGDIPHIPQEVPPTSVLQPSLSPVRLHHPVPTEPNSFLPATSSPAVGMSFLPPLPPGYLLPREVVMSNFDKHPIDFKGNDK